MYMISLYKGIRFFFILNIYKNRVDWSSNRSGDGMGMGVGDVAFPNSPP